MATALNHLANDARFQGDYTRATVLLGESLAIARRTMQLGAISHLTLLNAEQTYQQALISLVQAQGSRYADTSALFQALGGAWWNRTEGTSGLSPAASQARAARRRAHR